MTTITYHTWKVRQQVARLVLLCAIALFILPTIVFGTTKATNNRPVLMTAPSVASLFPPLSLKVEQPASLSHLAVLTESNTLVP